jgi:hypothetical protein
MGRRILARCSADLKGNPPAVCFWRRVRPLVASPFAAACRCAGLMACLAGRTLRLELFDPVEELTGSD